MAMPNASMNILIDEIEVSASHRKPNRDVVERLASSITNIDLQHPITIRATATGYSLVAGRHRLEAFRELGRDRIPASIVKMTDDEARMWEISENLHRSELTVSERSEQIAEYARLVKCRREGSAKPGQLAQVSGGRGREGGDSAAARDLGITREEIRRAEKIAAIDPSAKAAALAAGMDDNQSKLLQVAAVPADQQLAKVTELASRPAKLAPEPLNEFESREQWMAYMMRGWNRAPAAWREQFFARVDGTIFDETAMGAA